MRRKSMRPTGVIRELLKIVKLRHRQAPGIPVPLDTIKEMDGLEGGIVHVFKHGLLDADRVVNSITRQDILEKRLENIRKTKELDLKEVALHREELLTILQHLIDRAAAERSEEKAVVLEGARYGVPEVAKRLHRTPETIRLYISRGLLKAIKPYEAGGRYVITEKALRAFEQEKEQLVEDLVRKRRAQIKDRTGKRR